MGDTRAPEPVPRALFVMLRALSASRTPRVFVSCLLALASIAGCGDGSRAVADPQPGETSEVALQEGVVARGDFTAWQILTGELRSSASEVVTVPRLPAMESTIRFIVPDGSVVAEGDRLVELDTAQIASELDNKITQQQQALNELESKRAEIDGELAQKELAVAQADIAFEKAEIQASIPADVQSRKAYEESMLALENARVAHEKAVADLEAYRRSSQAELETLRIEKSKTDREVAEARRAIDTMVLRAPATGIAVASENRREDRKYQEGDTVYVGATVMEIPDLSRMMVDARLSDVDDGTVTPGMEARCTLDAYPERTFPCTVRSISPVAQESGWRSMQRHFRVGLDLDEVDSEIMRPGMSVKVQVRVAERSNVPLVPRTALVLDDDGAARLRTRSGEVPVTLGPCNARLCVLEEGPEPGTGLVTER